MKGDLRKEIILVLTFLAVATCAVLLVFALQRLIQIEKDMSSGFGENLMWALAQAQYEQQALALRVNEWNDGERSPAAMERLELQIDLTASRLKLLTEGPLGRGLGALAGPDLVADSLRRLTGIEPVLRQAMREGGTIAPSIIEPVLRDAAELRVSANRLMLNEREAMVSTREQYREALLEATLAIVFICACGVFIVLRLLTHARAAARAEQALRRDRDFSHLLLESSGDGVVAFDRELRCTHWNAAMSAVFPVPGRGPAVGRLIPETFSLPDDHVVMRLMRDTLAGENVFMDAHLVPGGARYIEKASHPLRSGETIIGGIMIVRDVTDAHLARLEVIEHKNQLEVLVESRTRDLREALERERNLRELYKGFVSMVSHQFRTPLSIVDSGAQRMMRRGGEMDGDEVRERAGRIRTAALRLTRLVTSTLNAARLDAGQIDISLRRCDLAKLVSEACERQSETAPDREFLTRLEALPPVISCDPLLIDQVLTNLLSNAVKYSLASEPIEIVAQADAATVQLSVQDRGIGIPAADRDKLFERFFRASTSSGIEGTGIGLHVARTIARLHGGDVEMRPREGGGSIFTMSLPREAAAP